MTAKKSNLRVVEKEAEQAVADAIIPDAPLPEPTMPILSRESVFLGKMQAELRDAQSDLDLIDHQIANEDARHAAVIADENKLHAANSDALGWQRADVQGVVDRCRLAIDGAGQRLPQPSDD